MTKPTGEIVQSQQKSLTLAQEFNMTESQIDLIKKQIAVGSSDEELRYFMTVANKSGLDPFTRQIYATRRSTKTPDGKYESKMIIQTGIDGYRVIAARTGELAGSDDIVYDTEEGVHPNKATSTVYRLVNGEPKPFSASARWKEYFQEKSMMWTKMPWLMLGKCAESLALRKAFPNELGVIRSAEEMGEDSENIREHSRARGKKGETVIEVEKMPEVKKLDGELNRRIHAVWSDLAEVNHWTEREEIEGRRKATLKALYKVESNNDLTEEQARAFIERVEKSIAEKRKAAEVLTPEEVVAELGGEEEPKAVAVEKCDLCKKAYSEDTDLFQCQAIRMTGMCDHCAGK